MDKLIVKGLGGIDGSYDCDLAGMLSLGSPETLTNKEGHRIKTMTGLRAGELEDALTQGDNDLLIALAAIVLTRRGKRFEEETLWDAPMGSGLDWELGTDEEGEAADPVKPPPTDEPELSGGASSNPISGHRESDPSGTGSPSSGTLISALDSLPQTSVI